FTGWDNEGRTIILGSNYFNGKIFEDDEDSDKYAQPDWWLEATRTLTRNRGGANNESNYLAELFAFVLRYCGSTG
ncbi:hypothetical protein, partial [Flavobacterium sp.]|uniref:hypothetical protein n=1 Tax=Flavobacterium sp. TaxID=239 RepID=UPI002B4B5AAB